MQTIQVVETAKWIISLYSDHAKQFILGGDGIWSFVRQRMGSEAKQNVSGIFEVSHELAVVREKLWAHPVARQVIAAFGLQSLVDPQFPIKLASLVDQADPGRQDEIFTLSQNWKVFSACIKPIELLTIPKEVSEERYFDEVLTIEVRYNEDVYPQAKSISDLVSHTIKLYEAVCRAGGYTDFPPLSVIYQASGSSVRFDFKGLGAPINQIKEFFKDAWALIRHRKSDDFHHRGKAIIEGLDLLDRIDQSQRRSALTSEEANRLRLQINRAMLALFQEGALTREVPEFEIVPNRELMQGMQQRLLPPAPETETPMALSKAPEKKRRKRNKRASKQNTDREESENSQPGESDL